MLLIHGGTLINEGSCTPGYLTVESGRILSIGTGAPSGELLSSADRTIDASGCWVLPGVIDDQVHFREPGLTEKGDIASESRAAAAGGVTSYMEMPNTRPPATTLELLEQKYARAAEVSAVNYSFYLGATNENLAEIERADPAQVCGLKVFMGSSTGNMLVDNQQTLASIFERSPLLVATHCEQEGIVQANLASARIAFAGAVPVAMHPYIRSVEACYRSTAHAVELAHRHGGRLHVLHLSTARELELFEQGKPIEQKRVTAEVCVHHLFFSQGDYARYGNRIKWNPAIKSAADRDALQQAVRSGRIDVVATDHAPHLAAEKAKSYLEAPSGGPLVQHSLPLMLTLAARGVFTPQQVVERMCHAPARLFGVEGRGFLRAGYAADIAVVRPNDPWQVSSEGLFYRCGWSPLEGTELTARVIHTLVNGQVVYADGAVDASVRGQRLRFAAR